ncbi:hypothetical protein PI125_g24664 [Phytophthora idaei]|nr:hypothetical protein PI125_g24664 [Phytophthora idaei]KAG3125567.1 hypothetical protein PI126_g22708 [Phytophthora idaei]
MFLFIVDVATRYKWVYLLEKKSQATWFILKLLRELETHHKDHKVLHLRSDQGGEFSSNELHEYCAEHDIVQQFTNAYSPQENGIAERANGIVLPRVRALLTATHLPNMLTTLNMLPTKMLGTASSYEKLYRRDPPLRTLRTWGCTSHARVPPESRQRK